MWSNWSFPSKLSGFHRPVVDQLILTNQYYCIGYQNLWDFSSIRRQSTRSTCLDKISAVRKQDREIRMDIGGAYYSMYDSWCLNALSQVDNAGPAQHLPLLSPARRSRVFSCLTHLILRLKAFSDESLFPISIRSDYILLDGPQIWYWSRRSWLCDLTGSAPSGYEEVWHIFLVDSVPQSRVERNEHILSIWDLKSHPGRGFRIVFLWWF